MIKDKNVLFDAIGDIDEKFIIEADIEKKEDNIIPFNKKKNKLKYIIPSLSGLCAAAIVVAILFNAPGNVKKGNAIADKNHYKTDTVEKAAPNMPAEEYVQEVEDVEFDNLLEFNGSNVNSDEAFGEFSDNQNEITQNSKDIDGIENINSAVDTKIYVFNKEIVEANGINYSIKLTTGKKLIVSIGTITMEFDVDNITYDKLIDFIKQLK